MEAARREQTACAEFTAGLFEGRVNWSALLPFPEEPSEVEEGTGAFLAELERVLRAELDPDEVDRSGQIPSSARTALARLGCFALRIPKEYGGLGFSQRSYDRIIHFIASYCASTAVFLSAHQSIGVPQPLLLFGTEEQKRKYLPRFRTGTVSAFALTEAGAGSDPKAMRTTAVPSADGKTFTLSGEKLYVTNGPEAEILLVVARTPSAEAAGEDRLSAFLVERSMPGVEPRERLEFMGMRGIQNGTVRFRDVRVPRENLVGPEGKGLRVAFETLNYGRLTMAAAAAGGAKRALQMSRLWAGERAQMGSKIGQFETVACRLGDMAADAFAADAVSRWASLAADRASPEIRLTAALAKLFCTERSLAAVEQALQVRGGRGYETAASLRRRGERVFPAERMLRDARAGTLLEGTSQILRLFIAREGFASHGEQLRAVLGKGKSFGDRVSAFFGLLRFYGAGCPLGRLGPKLPGELAGHAAFITRSARALRGKMGGLIFRHGSRLEGRQRALAAVADIAAGLFAMAVVCARAVSEVDRESAVHLASVFCHKTRGEVADAFRLLGAKGTRALAETGREVLASRYEWLERDIADF
ncbi:MAG: acyl-CoA dehydrogenase family protein [Candidatus Omnitrophota bacterium]